jgi:putative peptide zinc metalloprotease protein
MADTTPPADFWTAVTQAVDPTAYRPRRSEQVVVARLTGAHEPYYVLKQPLTQAYLRLSEADYAIWWQMDGRRSLKDLLLYSLRRYRALPIGRLNSLVADLRAGSFLCDAPTNLYEQIERQLTARAPASRGRRLVDGFLHSEIALTGLDDLFTPLYRRLHFLFTWPAQLFFILLILVGSVLFSRLLFQPDPVYTLSANGAAGIATLFLANILVIGLHEVAHALTTKHFGREVHRGGFLIYWGLPSFFVDTRDIWLSPRRARIAVSWAGPYSGWIIGSVAAVVLTAVALSYPQYTGSFWAGFLYQIGFIAFLSLFINLNPLLELDGYFILMDRLEMPGLRHRAFHFWQGALWNKLRAHKNLRRFWTALRPAERVFTFYGGVTLVYSAYALFFALYFWQSRLFPFAQSVWTAHGLPGKLIVLLVTAVIVVPALYALFHLGWGHIRAGLEWLARRDLLARPDVLALLTALPFLLGLPALFIRLPPLLDSLTLWLLHLATGAALTAVARQLSGSRFQWALWALTAVPAGLALAWVVTTPFWHDLGLLIAAAGVLAAGVVAWFTVSPNYLTTADRLLLGLFFVVAVAYAGVMVMLDNGRWLASSLILLAVFGSLALLTPLLINFWRSRFALPWSLLVLAILALPWLQFYPDLHLPVVAFWLYASLLYLLVGALAQFGRHEGNAGEVAPFSERERLVNGFNHFMGAMFASYEAVFGGRRLAAIQAQMQALGPIDPDDGVLQIADRARVALLLAVDRLDDLAGALFTRRAGQAAYDSLPWLEAETLGRNVLADTDWGSGLAQGFIRARDRRAQLIRQADIFVGFDGSAVEQTLKIVSAWQGRAGQVMATADTEATQFFLIEAGEVAVYEEGIHTATLTTGGYFGTMALLGSGVYRASYRTLTPVRALVIDRHRFNPLLRADTALAQQVNSGAQIRWLLKQMPLFGSLSPQQLATVDARLQHRHVGVGEVVARQGQPRSHLFIVAEGVVEALACDEANGTEVVVGRLGPGEHFGEYALFADKPYSYTYRTLYPTELLLLDEPTFDQLVATCDQMSHYVEQVGTGRLVATRRRLGLTAVLS